MMSVLQGKLHLPLVLLLQLSCIVTATCTEDVVMMLRRNLMDMDLALCNLVTVERDYVKHLFNANSSLKYRRNSLEPIPGITIPVGNSSAEVRATVCAISDYLERHFPPIVRNLTLQHRGQLLGNASVFYHQFKVAVDLTADQQRAECRRPVVSWHGYRLKKHGLGIIYYTRTWVEAFANLHPSCD